jgi:glucan biosynthesis protein C
MFAVGIVAGRRDWLRRLPMATGMTWLWIGLTAAAAHYALDLGGWRLMPAGLSGAARRHWGTVWSVWEAFICVGLCVGLLVFFRQRLDTQGALLRALSRGSYTVYIIHRQGGRAGDRPDAQRHGLTGRR